MTAIFAFTVMLNKRKALVYDTDAYYLFAGPYTRKQVNGYILFQSLRQGVLYGLLGCYMIAMFSMAGYFYHSLFSGMLCGSDADAGLFPSPYGLYLYVGAGE